MPVSLTLSAFIVVEKRVWTVLAGLKKMLEFSPCDLDGPMHIIITFPTKKMQGNIRVISLFYSKYGL